MSERSRSLPRRSCLSTPGSSDRFLAKAPTAIADMTFLDLEDSVAPNEKVAARAKVVSAIRTQDWGERVLCVRVNAWDTQWTYGDVIDVDDICAASPRLETIIFGPADFAASIEMPVLTGGVAIPEYPGDHFNYVFSRILMAGRANGLQVIDGPFLKVRELDALREFSMRTRMLGYDGKWALTPDQALVLNEVYSPTQEQFDRAWDILEAYRVATEENNAGAVMFGDEMIDEASRKMATKFVTRGERAGLKRSLE